MEIGQLLALRRDAWRCQRPQHSVFGVLCLPLVFGDNGRLRCDGLDLARLGHQEVALLRGDKQAATAGQSELELAGMILLLLSVALLEGDGLSSESLLLVGEMALRVQLNSEELLGRWLHRSRRRIIRVGADDVNQNRWLHAPCEHLLDEFVLGLAVCLELEELVAEAEERAHARRAQLRDDVLQLSRESALLELQFRRLVKVCALAYLLFELLYEVVRILHSSCQFNHRIRVLVLHELLVNGERLLANLVHLLEHLGVRYQVLRGRDLVLQLVDVVSSLGEEPVVTHERQITHQLSAHWVLGDAPVKFLALLLGLGYHVIDRLVNLLHIFLDEGLQACVALPGERSVEAVRLCALEGGKHLQ